MGIILIALNTIVSLAFLVFLILVLVKMFQNGQTGLGVVCIILCLCGIGVLVTFIVGWINANRWGITNIMIAWTLCWVVGIVLGFVAPLPLPFLPAR